MSDKYDPIIRYDTEACRQNRERAALQWRKRLAQFAEIGVKPRLLDMDDLDMLRRGEMPEFEPLEPPVLFPGDKLEFIPPPTPDAAQAVAETLARHGVTTRVVEAVIDSPQTIPPSAPVTSGTARAAGYTGDACSCGSFRTRRNGTCMVCDDCGTTTGCS